MKRVYFTSKEDMKDVLVGFNIALRCVFVGITYSHWREKVYKVNVEHDACIGVRVWFVSCITNELEFKVAVKTDVCLKER